MEFSKIKNETRTDLFLAKDTTDFLRGIAILVILFGHILQFGLPSYSGFFKILYHLSSAGAAMFLFLSGYASAVSSAKKESLGFSWLLKRIIRLYLTFIPVYAFSFAAAIIQKNPDVQINIGTVLYQLSTMTLPLFLNWYLKVQAALYIVFYIFSLLPKRRMRGILTLAVSVLYVVVCLNCKVQNFWFLSVLCFPLGAIIGDFRGEIISFYNKASYGRIAVFIGVALLYWFSYSKSLGVRKSAVYTNLILVLAVALIAFDFKIKLEPVNFFGRYSLEIYLWHLCLIGIMYLSAFPNLRNRYKIIIILALSPILALITNKAVTAVQRRIIRKK